MRGGLPTEMLPCRETLSRPADDPRSGYRVAGVPRVAHSVASASNRGVSGADPLRPLPRAQ
jgi:hypothetical protein